jgi:hypothetical protein
MVGDLIDEELEVMIEFIKPRLKRRQAVRSK